MWSDLHRAFIGVGHFKLGERAFLELFLVWLHGCSGPIVTHVLSLLIIEHFVLDLCHCLGLPLLNLGQSLKILSIIADELLSIVVFGYIVAPNIISSF